MKRIMLLALVSLMTLSALQAQISKASLQATGLTCALCSNAINKAVQKLPFVATVRSDIKNSSFSIVFKEGMEPDIDAIKMAVEDAGFSVGGLQLTGQIIEPALAKDNLLKIGGNYFHVVNGEGKSLRGETVISVVDKNFIPEKEYKKRSGEGRLSCVKDGKATPDCTLEGLSAGTRVYHVII